MGLNGVAGWFYCKAAGHAEVNAQRGVGVETDEDFFASAGDAGDTTAGEEGGKINVTGLDNVGPQVLDGGDALADQVGREGADDCFDFRQLWHATIVLEAHP